MFQRLHGLLNRPWQVVGPAVLVTLTAAQVLFLHHLAGSQRHRVDSMYALFHEWKAAIEEFQSQPVRDPFKCVLLSTDRQLSQAAIDEAGCDVVVVLPEAI